MFQANERQDLSFNQIQHGVGKPVRSEAAKLAVDLSEALRRVDYAIDRFADLDSEGGSQARLTIFVPTGRSRHVFPEAL
jgi:hypothetical protein